MGGWKIYYTVGNEPPLRPAMALPNTEVPKWTIEYVTTASTVVSGTGTATANITVNNPLSQYGNVSGAGVTVETEVYVRNNTTGTQTTITNTTTNTTLEYNDPNSYVSHSNTSVSNPTNTTISTTISGGSIDAQVEARQSVRVVGGGSLTGTRILPI
jgi:hypothetical protein